MVTDRLAMYGTKETAVPELLVPWLQGPHHGDAGWDGPPGWGPSALLVGEPLSFMLQKNNFRRSINLCTARSIACMCPAEYSK